MAPRPDQSVDAPPVADPATKAYDHNGPLDGTVQVNHHLYDTKQMAAFHPGGELFVKAFSGKDATEAFLSYHRREFPHTKLAHMRVGSSIPKKGQSDADAEYIELCAIVEQVLPRHKSFAPFHYYIKVFVILTSAIGLEIYIHKTGQYKWYLTGLLGWVFALIGLNIQHDANHGAVSRHPTVNRLLGIGQNWIGGSAVDWIHQHVVQHHVNTNDVDHDPDIVGNPILRFNPKSPIAKHHIFQYLYMFVLLALFGFTYIGDSLKHNMDRFHFTAYSKALDANTPFEIGTILLFTARWMVAPLFLSNASILTTYLNIAPLFLVGGYYLSFFFVISHNFDGVHMHSAEFLKKEQSFLRKQASTSSNVGGSLLCFMNGGLNYQIEHHLFPRVSHTHYPTIAPIVREFCKSKNIPYVHFPTIWDNVSSCARHMYHMGSQPHPVNYHTKS